MVRLSILELARVVEGGSVKASLDHARDTARHAEGLGFHRFWIAEHHNMVGIASAATALVIQHVAAGTARIRVGAGGIMLPNHAPYVIAEQFGTLAALFPGRIDLGLGRAPGSDQFTTRALRRDPLRAESFPQDVLELQAYLAPEQPGQRVIAVPGVASMVPLWILGSSLFGAQLAAELGLPFAFASHFAPAQAIPALQTYRSRFRPSQQLARPYAMAGLNIVAADTEAAAKRIATTQQMSFADLIRGQRGLSRPPIDDIDSYWTGMEKAHAQQMLSRSIIGDIDVVREGMRSFIEETGADELMIVTDAYHHEDRLRSLQIIAEAGGQLADVGAHPSTLSV